MKLAASMLLVAMGCVVATAQATPAAVYVESFRKGATKVRERAEEVHLSVREPLFESVIKDSGGDNHFRLAISPVRVDAGDPSIIGWQVSLEDAHRRMYGNLLLPYRDTVLNQGPKGNAFRLDPSTYAVVPLRAERVIKVENFYCVIQVRDFRLIVPERWHLDSMDVDVQLTNTKPLGNHN